MDENRQVAGPTLKTRVLFRSTVIQAISDMEDEKGTLEDVLNLIVNTFFFAISKRKGAREKVTHFSVNIWDRGRIILFRVKATTTSDSDRKLIVIDVLPETEWGTH